MEQFIEWAKDPVRLTFGIVAGSFILLAAFIMPVQAYRRGHGFVSWFILQFLVMNPLYPLVIVGLLPNKAKMRLREVYTAELENMLRSANGSNEAK